MIRVLFLAVLAANLLVARPRGEEPFVAAEAKATRTLKAGEGLPEVSIRDAKGKVVKLGEFHADGLSELVFFWGSWCPICPWHLQDGITVHSKITKLSANMVAIRPASVGHTKGNTDTLKAPFPLLPERDLIATKAFGLAFTVEDATIANDQGPGIDLEESSGRAPHGLWVLAVDIVDKSGKIIFAPRNPDDAKRLDAGAILAEVKKLP